MRVNNEQVKRAREADIFSFLSDNYPEDYVKEGDNILRHKDYDSLKIFRGYGKGAFRYSIGVAENAIDYLNRHIDDYDSSTPNWFQRAVIDLLPYSPEIYDLDEDGRYVDNGSYVVHTKAKTIKEKVAMSAKEAENRNDEFILPPKIKGNYTHVFAYLTKTRCIPQSVVARLFHEKLLYEDNKHNCVFVSAHCNYAEVRGTYTDGKPFKKSIGKVYNGGYWAFNAKPTNSIIFICEAAIDAISLYCLLGYEDATYVSVGGCQKFESVCHAINNGNLGSGRYVIAFDNDNAGNEAYLKLKNELRYLERILPNEKDWNDDLFASTNVASTDINKAAPRNLINIKVPEITWNELHGENYCYEGILGTYGTYIKSETTITPQLISLFIRFCSDINNRFRFWFRPYELHNMFVDKYKPNLTYNDSIILTEIAAGLNNNAA